MKTSPLIGAGWMILTGLLFVGVIIAVKHTGDRIPAPQAAFLRYLIGLVFVLPVLTQLRTVPRDKRLLSLFAGRGLCHAAGVSLWFYAMTQIPIAEVTALNYLSPVYVTLGAALFLGERFSAARAGAILTALLGVTIILRPGFREISPGHIAMLGTAVLFAGSYLIAKVLSADVRPMMVVTMLSIWTTIGLAPWAAAVWVWPNLHELTMLSGVAILATAGHFTMTLAFQSAPISLTQPVTFLQLIWATLLGWWLFGETPDSFVIAGGTIIVGSVVAISIREAQKARRTPPIAP